MAVVMPEKWLKKLELKQLHKLSDRKPRLPDDGPQGATIYLLVIRNNNLGKGIISPQDHMAALTPLYVESRSPRTSMHSLPEITGNLFIPPPRELRNAPQE